MIGDQEHDCNALRRFPNKHREEIVLIAVALLRRRAIQRSRIILDQ